MERLLYLNKYTAIIARGQEIFFEINGSFNLAEHGYVLNDAQEKHLQLMLDGKGFSEEEYIRIWGEKTVKDFLNDNILISKDQDISSFNSRTAAYFDFEHIDNGVEQLLKKTVMVLGCGSIGTHVAWNLAATGVGKLVLVDFDRVEESNINRQLMFDIDDVGKLKTEVLKEKLSRINLTGTIVTENIRITSQSMLEELCLKYDCDLIVRAADTPEEFSVWLDHVCEELKLKYVSGTMTGTYFAVGPTYLGDEKSTGYSKFFPQSTDYKIIAGRRPSVAIQLSYCGALISAEACRILLGLKDYLYLNKIVFEEPLHADKMEMVATNSNIEVDEERKHTACKNVLLFAEVLLIVYSLSGLNIFFWIGGIIILMSSVAIFTLPSRAVEAAVVNSIIYFLIGFIIMVVNQHIISSEQGVLQSVISVFFIFTVYSFFIFAEASLAFILSNIKNKLTRRFAYRPR